MDISRETDALLRFYGKRKFISVKDIREFSETYTKVQAMLKDVLLVPPTPDAKGE